MRARSLGPPALVLSLLGCASSGMHVPASPEGSTFVQGFYGEASSVELGETRLRPSVCEHVDRTQEHRTLGVDDFLAFLHRQGLETEVTRARGDLVYVDVTNAGTEAPLRFRVAILESPGAAGRDLHVALLQHGAGWWGVHRGNLAVLGPEGSDDDIVAFAAKTKLACWGVLTISGLDDTYVLAGGYTEL